jgi:hypothetical protein
MPQMNLIDASRRPDMADRTHSWTPKDKFKAATPKKGKTRRELNSPATPQILWTPGTKNAATRRYGK